MVIDMSFKDELDSLRNPEFVKIEAEQLAAKKANGFNAKVMNTLTNTANQIVGAKTTSDSINQNSNQKTKQSINSDSKSNRRQDLKEKTEDLHKKAKTMQQQAQDDLSYE